MNFLIFTPTSISSAIARMAAGVVRELLDRGHCVAVVNSSEENYLSASSYNFSCEVVFWKDGAAVNRLAANADAIVYQVGDNFRFHAGCVEWLYKLPGIVCLHDYFLGNLFWGWAFNKPRTVSAEIFTQFYGADNPEYFDYPDIGTFIEGTHKTMPMTEWIAALGQAVIVHSGWGIQRVAAACAGPVRVVPLAYDRPAAYASLPAPGNPAKKFTVLTIGHVNANKRVESVISAIASSSVLRDVTCYHLVGPIDADYAGVLRASANAHGVELVIEGEVDEDRLAQAIHEADVMCCLRWPSLEAASASTIEAMLCGRPVVVTDTGFYSELPANCVIKIAPDNELEGLQTALESLCANTELRVSMGACAEAFAMKTFTASGYVLSLVELAEDVRIREVSLLGLTPAIDMMNRWGIDGHKAVSAIAGQGFELFGIAAEEHWRSTSKARFATPPPGLIKRVAAYLHRSIQARPEVHERILPFLRRTPYLKKLLRRFLP